MKASCHSTEENNVKGGFIASSTMGFMIFRLSTIQMF